MATLIRTNGQTTEITPRDKRGVFSLDELKALVGGYIEMVRLPVGLVGNYAFMVVNEEGHIHGLELNLKATALYQVSRPTDWTIVGDVVLVTRHEADEDERNDDDLDA